MNYQIIFLVTFSLFNFLVCAQPVNNSCSNAIPLCPGILLSGTTTNATSDASTDYSFCYAPSSTIWYKFTTGNVGGAITVDFTNLVFNPNPSMGQSIEAQMISATTVCSISSYTPISACSGSSSNFSVTSAISLSSNTTYFVQINGTNTGAGVTQPAQCDFDISITGDVLYQTEETISVCYGSDYTFPDGTTASTITSDITHNSDFVSVISGCDSVVVTNLDVQPQVNIVATQAGVTFNANSIIADYQWVDCDNSFSEISGATSQSYTATENGHYACVITENGCTDTSTCFEADFTGIIENDFSFLLYPNPAQAHISVVLSNPFQESTLIIKDIHGRQIQVVNISDKSEFQFDISQFVKGIYVLVLVDSEGKISERKFIVE